MKEASIYIEPLVYRKIMHWIDKADSSEVSGLGKLMIDGDGDIVVIDAILCKQVNSSGSSDLDEQDVNKAMFDLRDTKGELRWWWHSHALMGVFWSGTDKDTIGKLGGTGWIVSTVFNKKREHKSSIYMGSPLPVFKDDVTFRLLSDRTPAEVVAAWDAEYDAKVEKHSPLYGSLVSSGHGRGAFINGSWIDDEDIYWEQQAAKYELRASGGCSDPGDRRLPKQSAVASSESDGISEDPSQMYLDKAWLLPQQLDQSQAQELEDYKTFAGFLDDDEQHVAIHNIEFGYPWWDDIFNDRAEAQEYVMNAKGLN